MITVYERFKMAPDVNATFPLVLTYLSVRGGLCAWCQFGISLQLLLLRWVDFASFSFSHLATSDDVGGEETAFV